MIDFVSVSLTVDIKNRPKNGSHAVFKVPADGHTSVGHGNATRSREYLFADWRRQEDTKITAYGTIRFETDCADISPACSIRQHCLQTELKLLRTSATGLVHEHVLHCRECAGGGSVSITPPIDFTCIAEAQSHG